MKQVLSASFVVMAVLSWACGSGAERRPAMEEQDPRAFFASLEERLISSDSLRVDFDVTAEGAVSAAISGSLFLGPDGSAVLNANGDFAGENVVVSLTAGDGGYQYGTGATLQSGPTPSHLKEGLLIGFTRMGILHNLAMLVGNAPPDGVEGGVRDWVQVDSLAFLEAGSVGAGGVSFHMAVGGVPAGSVELEVGKFGLPLVRRQTVLFPTGEMRVTERYSGFSIVP